MREGVDKDPIDKRDPEIKKEETVVIADFVKKFFRTVTLEKNWAGPSVLKAEER